MLDSHLEPRDNAQRRNQQSTTDSQERIVPALGVSVIAITFGNSISGLVVEYIVAIDVARVRFPTDAYCWAALRLEDTQARLQ